MKELKLKFTCTAPKDLCVYAGIFRKKCIDMDENGDSLPCMYLEATAEP